MTHWTFPSIAGALLCLWTAAPNYQIRVLSQTWNGPDGIVVVDGKPVKMPALAWNGWKPPPVFVKGQLQTPKHDEIALFIHGAVVQDRLGNQDASEPDKQKNYYLSYPLTVDPGTLALTTTQGKNTAWKRVDVVKQTKVLRRLQQGHHEDEQTEEFQLEALNRPGWYLTVNDQSQFTLSKNPPPKPPVKFIRRLYYDNLNDGK